MNAGEDKVTSALPDLAAGVLSAGLLVVNIVVDVDEPAWLTVLSLVCFGVAVPLVVLPFFHLAKYGLPKPGDAFFATTRVAEDGVYSFVRHPQYIGYMLLMVGFACLDPHPAALGLAGAAVVFFYLQCVAEERFCTEAFGADYRLYMQRVPRLNLLLGLYRRLSRKNCRS